MAHLCLPFYAVPESDAPTQPAFIPTKLSGLSLGENSSLPVPLPSLKVPPLPIWLTVHREIRTSRRIRAVYDFLAQAVPQTLQP